MIVNLTRGAKTASLHLPADRFQIAGVLSYTAGGSYTGNVSVTLFAVWK